MNYFIQRLGKLFLMALFVSLVFSVTAFADNCYYVGDGAAGDYTDTDNWSATDDDAGGDCGTGLPTDIAYFNGNGTSGNENVTVPSGISATQLQTGNNYESELILSNGLSIEEIWFDSPLGTLTAPSGTLTLSDDFRLFDGTFDHNNGTVVFSSTPGVSVQLIPPDSNPLTFNNLTFDKGASGEVSFFDATVLEVEGTLSLTSGSVDFDTGTDKISTGSSATVVWNSNFEGFGDAYGTIEFQHANNFTIPDLGSIILPNVIIDNSSLTVTTTGDVNTLSITSSNRGDFTINAGAVNPTGTNIEWTIGGDFLINASTFDASGFDSFTAVDNFYMSGGTFEAPSSGELHIGDNFHDEYNSSSGAVFNHNNGTVIFDETASASVTISGGSEFGNFTVQKDGSGDFLSVSGGAININGDVNIDTGTLSTGNNAITVSGDNWTVGTNGSLSQFANGSVTFDGSDLTLAGDTTFSNFTKTTNSTIYFTAGSTTTITGTWTLTGTASNPIHLRSTSDGDYWYVDPQGTRDLDYISVKDSNNSSGTTITLSSKYADDEGHNFDWDFTGANPLPAAAAIPEFSTWLLILTLIIGSGLIVHNNVGVKGQV